MCLRWLDSRGQTTIISDVKYITCSYLLSSTQYWAANYTEASCCLNRKPLCVKVHHCKQPQAQIASSDIRPKPSVSMPNFNKRWSGLLSSRGNTSIMATYRNVPASSKATG